MTNAELISMVRSIAKHGADWRINEVLNRAADALEAAEHRIEDLEGALAACRIRKDGRIPKEGEWISDYDGFEYDVRCSVCGEEALIKEGGSHDHAYSHYCPNCGARMQTVTNCHTLEEGERKEKKNEKDSDTI